MGIINMQKNIGKKAVVIAIIVLFVCMNITSSYSIGNLNKSTKNVSNGNTLYVGGNGTSNYTRIQDAIDNASNGDTVFVYDASSPYYEYIVISKRINLTGENKETTIIEGNGSRNFTPIVILNASSSFVTIQGFTITNGYCGIDIESDNNTIIGNIIAINSHGLGMSGSDYTNIIDNIIIMNNRSGLGMTYCQNNIILGNNITTNSDCGISIFGLSNYNIIKDNLINSNDIGIYFEAGCNFNVISGNTILNNSESSIILVSGKQNVFEGNNIEIFGLLSSPKNTIIKNNFIGNVRHVYSYTSFFNKWDANYWDDWIGLKSNLPIIQKLPKVIVCYLLYWRIHNIAYFSFDRHPAKEPYNILK